MLRHLSRRGLRGRIVTARVVMVRVMMVRVRVVMMPMIMFAILVFQFLGRCCQHRCSGSIPSEAVQHALGNVSMDLCWFCIADSAS